tara:strand:- start:241 stop:1329 length:1089 start_codon:yes stop_codon:yes gene_type:complete
VFSKFYYYFFLPAAIFQSVIIGGGYATGREIVEFVTRNNPKGGLISLAVISLTFSLLISISFVFAKMFSKFEYRGFLNTLLGRFWIAYEICFILLLIIIIAVVCSAASQTIFNTFGISSIYTLTLTAILIVSFSFLGNDFVEKSLSCWTIVILMSALAFFFATGSHNNFFERLATAPEFDSISSIKTGFMFALYNSALIPVLIYSVKYVPNTKIAALSGIFTGMMGAAPAFLLHFSLMGDFPTIIDIKVPVFWKLNQLSLVSAQYIYVVALFGTLILTAVGILRGVSERVNGWLIQKSHRPLSKKYECLLTGAIIFSSLALSQVGIITLVSKGYSLLGWAFFCIFTIPLLSVGIYKIFKNQK